MKIEVENLGVTHRDFIQLRDELIAQSRQFDENTLPLVPYEHLVLCCTGEAGAAACSLDLIRAEKRLRRERFLNMHPEQLVQATNFLLVERMYDDIEVNRAKRTVPHWEDLTNRQRAWFKLNCISNHLDQPLQRLGEAILLLVRCAERNELPREMGNYYASKLRQLYHDYAKLTDQQFRQKIWDIAEDVKEFLPDAERSICDKEELQDFRCTSDCFRVLP